MITLHLSMNGSELLRIKTFVNRFCNLIFNDIHFYFVQ